MGKKKFQYTAEQAVNCANCISVPGIGCAVSNNAYHLKFDADHKAFGHIQEDSSCCCRCLCMPYFRTSRNEITFHGGSKKYYAHKDFNCSYCFPILTCCCCRPDVKVYDQAQKLVGQVVLPFCANIYCKFQVDCYAGD